jgi:hypothetical protein
MLVAISLQMRGSRHRTGWKHFRHGPHNSEKNSGVTAGMSLFVVSLHGCRPRVSAGNGVSVADNFLQKQQGQREVCPASMALSAGFVHLVNASDR